MAQLGARFHGMEEVVGSIPTRSTKSLNQLDGAGPHGRLFWALAWVIIRRFGAYGKDFQRFCSRAQARVVVQPSAFH